MFTARRPVYGEHDLDRLANGRLVIALDQISDPQNLGAMLRAAAFFGADAVLLLKNRSAELTPKVARIAVGGAEFVDVFRVTNLARSLDILREYGFWVYGLDERGEHTLRETEFDRQSVLVVGAEGQGLRQRTRTKCDALVRIPGGREGVESLNAAVATAIALADMTAARAASRPALVARRIRLLGERRVVRRRQRAAVAQDDGGHRHGVAGGRRRWRVRRDRRAGRRWGS